MIELITHLAVILFILGDSAWHAWKWWQKRKNREQLYTLDEARAVLFAEAMMDQRREMTTKV